MKKLQLIAIVSLIILINIACGIIKPKQPTPIPTIIPTQTTEPTATLVTPTVTNTPTSTNTPMPSSTPESTDLVWGKMGELRVVIPNGGFSIEMPVDYEYEYNENTIVVMDEEDKFVIQVGGSPFLGYSLSEEKIAQQTMISLSQLISGDLQLGKENNIEINGYKGKKYQINGKVKGSPIKGEIFVVKPGEQQFILGYGFSTFEDGEKNWREYGAPYFEELIKTIEITDVSKLEECKVSDDPTYGYTKENPIRVGGMAFGGPSRERAYLENLVDLNGGELFYERTGSQDFGNTILDVYAITGSQEKIILYIDEYSYEKLMAPKGLNCKGPFLLGTP